MSNDANKALGELSGADRPIAEQLFKALTDIDENGRKIRRRVNLSELMALTGTPKKELLGIIDYFVKDRRSFLYVREVADSGDILIDISHESLIRQWDKLDEWVNEESETAKFYKRLAEACRQYNLEVKEKDLLIGSELDLALEWRDKYKPTAVWANRYKVGFDASIGYLEESEAERIRQQTIDEKRTRMQRTTTLAVMGLLILITLATGIVFLTTNHNTNTRVLHNEARALANIDPTMALKKAVLAVKRSGSLLGFYDESQRIDFKNTLGIIYKEHSFYKIVSSTGDTLIKEISSGGTENVIKTGDSLIKAISSDGTKIFIKANSPIEDSTYRLLNATGEIQKEFDLSTFEYASFSRDGSKLFICCTTGPGSVLWDVHENDSWNFPALVTADNQDVILFPKQDRLVINIAQTGPVMMYSIDQGLIKTIQTKAIGGVTFMVMDPLGKKLFISGNEKHELYDSQGEPIANSNIHPNIFSPFGRLSAAAFSQDGQQILTASATEKKATLWDLKGNIIADFEGHRGLVNFVTFTPNNAQIITAAHDNRVILWNRRGDIIQEFLGHKEPIISVKFTQDGKSILTFSQDGTTRLWQLNNGVSNNYLPLDEPVREVSYSSKESMILTGFDNGDATLWGPQNEKIRDFRGYSQKFQKSPVALSSDGSHAITVGRDLHTRLWTIARNKIVDSTIFAGTGHVKVFAFSPDGKYIVSGSRNGSVLLKNLKGEILSQINFPEPVSTITFAPLDNEKLVVVGTGFKSVLLDMNASHAKIIKEYDGHSDYVVSVAFAPDGKK